MEAQVALSIVGGLLGKGIGGQLTQLGIQFGVGSYFLKNSRQNEQEADLLGTDIMYDTGYNPRWMAEFFRKLQQTGGARTVALQHLLRARLDRHRSADGAPDERYRRHR